MEAREGRSAAWRGAMARESASNRCAEPLKFATLPLVTEIGQRVGDRFELVSRVGAGAFGAVFRALDTQTGRVVAVKRLHGYLDDRSALARFAREAAALSKVQSPHVVAYVAHGVDGPESDPRPWLATEWIEGTDLARLKSRAQTTRAKVLRALADVLRGAEALHAVGLVHRDLKPSNVFVPFDDGPTRIVDLGVARWIDGTVLTDAGAILGTPAYMAPEQVRGERVDGRADLWSVGVMLFELVAGDTPFGSQHAIAVLGRVLLDPAPSLASVDPSVPPALAALVAALLDKNPAQRPSDCEAIARRIEEVLGDPRAASWLAGAPRWSVVSDEAVAPTTQQSSTRGERRWIAMLAARLGGAARERWTRRCQVAGARVEVLRDATLVGFGLREARGDELSLAARSALEARVAGASVALVAGWVEVVGGAPLAGPLLDRVATVLDRAAPGEVLAQLEGAERLGDHFDIEGCDDGLAKIVGVRAHSVDGEDSGSHRLLGRVVGAVGREKELALLSALVHESAAEQSARAAIIVGEPGLGKSRLLAELRTRTRALERRPRWIVLRGDPMSSDVPNAMVLRALRAMVGGDGAVSADAALEWARVALGVEPGRAVLDGLLSLLGVAPTVEDGAARPASDRVPTDSAQRLELEHQALVSVLRASLERQPLVIAIEDLHWADRASVDTIGRLFFACADSALTLLAVAQPELSARHPNLWRGMARTELRLSPLSERASEALVNAVLELAPDERRALVRRAGGNPLFLEELLRARAAGLVALPAAVQSVLQARLDALGPDVRRVAQCASVFGPTFWSEGVAALRGARSVGAALVALERAELVTLKQGSRIAHCVEYAFSHALARDAAYAMLVESDRKALHLRAAEWLSSVGERDPAVLAQHMAAAGRGFEAADHLRRAAQLALSESAFADAVEHCTRALELSPKGDGAIEAWLLRATAFGALGRPREMLADAERARDERGADVTSAIRARALCGEALFALGALDEADAALRAVLEESHASLVGARVQALVRLAEVDIANGRGAEGDGLIDEALSWLEDAGAGFDLLRLRARRVRAQALVAAGDPARALREARLALRDAEALAHRAAVIEGRIVLGQVLTRVGAIDQAAIELSRCRAELESLRSMALRAQLEAVWAALEAERAPLADVREACERAVELARECGRPQLALQSALRRSMAEALTEGAAFQTVEGVEASGVLGAIALAIAAEERLRRGEVAAAIASSERAAQRLGPRAEAFEGESFVRWVQARALLAAERVRDADAVLDRAREKLGRKAARFSDEGEREHFIRGTVARRALLALVEARRAR